MVTGRKMKVRDLEGSAEDAEFDKGHGVQGRGNRGFRWSGDYLTECAIIYTS